MFEIPFLAEVYQHGYENDYHLLEEFRIKRYYILVVMKDLIDVKNITQLHFLFYSEIMMVIFKIDIRPFLVSISVSSNLGLYIQDDQKNYEQYIHGKN